MALWPQYLEQQPFEPPPYAGPNDRLVSVSVSSQASDHRQLTLQRGHLTTSLPHCLR